MSNQGAFLKKEILLLTIGLVIGLGISYFITSYSLKIKINDQEKQINSLTSEVSQINLQTSTLQANIDNLQSKISQEQEEKSNLQSEISILKSETSRDLNFFLSIIFLPRNNFNKIDKCIHAVIEILLTSISLLT